jgi:hypothetical protein
MELDLPDLEYGGNIARRNNDVELHRESRGELRLAS